MPITDLSDVTSTIIKLLQLGLDPPPGTTTIVSAIPPDEIESSNANQVSVHLLHITESPEFKNFPPGPRVRNVPIQQLPMGLVLQYVVSIAREASTGGGSTSPEAILAQKLLGKIARLFHDFPIITPTTAVGLPPPAGLVLQGGLADGEENLELILRPAALEENLNFWATQNQKLARACLFIEARIAVLQQQPPQIIPGVVLSVGNFVFPSAGPQLFNSRNTLSFRAPNQPGLVTATASPARVAFHPDLQTFDDDPDNAGILDNALLHLEGTGFSPGRRFLFLRVRDQSIKLDLDEPHPNANDRWDFIVGANEITLRFRTEVHVPLGTPPEPTIVRFAPGTYGARVMLEDTRLGPTARPRTSNEIAFAVIPEILEAGPSHDFLGTPATNDYMVEIAGRYLVRPPGDTTPGFPDVEQLTPPPPTIYVPTVPELDFFVNGVVYTRVNSLVAVTPGKYFVFAPNVIRFQLLDPLTNVPGPSNPLPVQLLVNGLAATPAWLVTQAT